MGLMKDNDYSKNLDSFICLCHPDVIPRRRRPVKGQRKLSFSKPDQKKEQNEEDKDDIEPVFHAFPGTVKESLGPDDAVYQKPGKRGSTRTSVR